MLQPQISPVCFFRFLGIAITLVVISQPSVLRDARGQSQQLTVAPQGRLTNTARSSRSMVATVHPAATRAAIEVLDDGGNAVDAAVTAGLTLGVVDGFNSGIGGGCFILIRCPDGTTVAIDGREMAPAAAHIDLFREAEKTMEQPSRLGPLASGVPGALAAFAQAVRQYGRLPLSRSLRPGTELAEQGFVVSKTYAGRLRSVEKLLHKYPGTASVLLRKQDGKLRGYREGETLVQKDLAKTYRAIAEHGTEWFYRGAFARQTAQWMRDHGGIMTEKDFANYRTVLRQPVTSTYRGHTIVGFPPPSSGGVHVGQILNILENHDLGKLHAENPADMYHLIAEAMKFAFADRAYWLGDPDFVNVPKGLVAPSYASGIAKKINMETVTPTDHGVPPKSDSEFFPKHTTHIAAADREGYFVAITSTVNTTFGSKVIVPGLGVVMNNQMDDFVAIPDKPNAFGLVGGKRNAVEARKRPLSSMSPTIVLKDGQPVLTLGAAGGPKIITEVVNAIVHHIDLGKPIDAAIAAPRIHHQWRPDVLMIEQGFDENIEKELKRRGHQIRRISAVGICQGISFDPIQKQFHGAADPRIESAAGGQR